MGGKNAGEGNGRDAEAALRSLVAKVKQAHQPLLRAMRRELKKRFPTALELVYDYPNSLVISYSPIERGSEAPVTIAAGADGIRLYFNNGPKLPDPQNMLLGSAKVVRYIMVESVNDLKRPAVRALISAAVAMAKIPLPGTGSGGLIIKSSSSKKKARRRAKK